ncbi:hypothetical protein TEA_022164 [Camellia sinensis var. sinensis]|uniref:GRAM domain-containing protein n=1 Tax=Camellia sinensis var. sinensis TaxID=542762 RepID=A0A4S4EGY3_CAMSN|nr:hypothetical protein TEA_022164 [Camellia sinensis var. sinensis]
MKPSPRLVALRLGVRFGHACPDLVDTRVSAVSPPLKTGPSFADAAVGRIAQGTKVLAEGGYEKVFRQTFETVPEEKLLNSYACYLSTSAGPVMGTLYVSTAKLAFCSDNPLSYKVGDQTQWSYYKCSIISLIAIKVDNKMLVCEGQLSAASGLRRTLNG